MSRLPDHVIDDIRNRVDIVDVVSEYVRLQRSGRSLKGLCPFHSEKTPSFHVDPEQQLFYCFGCQTGGNVFNFLMKVENAPFGEVVRRLAERAGVPIEEVEPSPEQARMRREREAIYRANEVAVEFFVRALFSREGVAARRYLKERGLNEKAVKTFRIGFAPDDWHRLEQHLIARGIDVEVGIKAGLLGRGRRGVFDWLRNRVVFPIVDTRGRVVGFGGRILAGDQVKYLNTAESPVFSKRRQLYGLDVAAKEIARAGRAVVVEGYMDVVSLHAHGFGAAVASLGTAFTPEQAKLLRRYAGEAVLAYDADTAGQAATMRGLDILAKAGLEVRVARIPKGHDPDSLVRERGLDAFLRLVDTSSALVEYKLDEALKDSDLTTVEGRVQAVRAVLPVLAAIDSPVAREGYVSRVAARIGVTEAALVGEMRRFGRANRGESSTRHNLTRNRYTNRDLPAQRIKRETQGAKSNRPNPGRAPAVERDLMVWLLKDPSRASEVSARLGDEPFLLQEYNRLFAWILSQGERAATGETVVGRIDDPEIARLAGALMIEGGQPPGPFKIYLQRVEEESMRRRVRELEAKLTRLMKDDQVTPDRIGRLVGEYKRIRDRLYTMVGRDKAS